MVGRGDTATLQRSVIEEGAGVRCVQWQECGLYPNFSEGEVVDLSKRGPDVY